METIHGTSDGGVERVVDLERTGNIVAIHIHPPGKPESSSMRMRVTADQLREAVVTNRFPIAGGSVGDRGQPRELASRVENGERLLDVHLVSGAGGWWVWVPEERFREALDRLGIGLDPVPTTGLREHLIGVARRRSVTYYGEICGFFGLDGIRGEGDVARISAGLGALAQAEHDAGRPLLPAVVINRELNNPGPGFFTVAREAGRFRKGDELSYWTGELNAVHDFWAKQPR